MAQKVGDSFAPTAQNMRVEIDLIGSLDFTPAGRREYVAAKHPVAFRIHAQTDGHAWIVPRP